MSKNKWTLADMPDLSGKVIIVTGGNGGLGFQTVKAFANKGAEVVIACRSDKKGEAAKTEIQKLQPDAKIAVMKLDLSDFSSVRSFADTFNAGYNQLDILLNNAGIMMTPYGKTVDGIELQQGTNYFGHFLLTGLLMEKLRSTPKSRVVCVSSIAHKTGKMNFHDLLYEKDEKYTPMGAYSRSKLEALHFTFGLQHYFKSNKIDAIATVAHPGVSDTNLFNQIGSDFFRKLFMPLFKWFVQPADMGALPLLRAAVDPEAKGGEFYGPDGIGGVKGYPVVVRAKKHAYKEKHTRKLWKYSEKITGIKFEKYK